ncbi:hypothetical protein EDF70_104188 [Neorhizobium sp. JUb45]|nr:hypothetical protein EDF70_104188 [Neorhizobium sp. JUb45]
MKLTIPSGMRGLLNYGDSYFFGVQAMACAA